MLAGEVLYSDRKVDEVLTFEYRLRGSVYAAAIALDLFFGLYSWCDRPRAFRPEEEAEFDMVMAQARTDAWTFGISQRFEAYLEQFAPEERMQHILAMFAALENQLELCLRLLCIESEVNRHDPKYTEPIKFIE